MSDDSKIEWCDASWNPVRGCSRVSRGCGSSDGGGCYAERRAHRFSGPGQPYEGLTRATKEGPRWTGKIRLVPEALDLPLKWRKPRRVFVNSMSDLFHERVPDEFIAAVFGVMAACPQHVFQVLTKRPERARRWFEWIASELPSQHPDGAARGVLWYMWERGPEELRVRVRPAFRVIPAWPLPNVMLGVSVEDQRAADERIPLLLQMPAAVRFVSCEPLLELVDLEYPKTLYPNGPPTCCDGRECGCMGLPTDPPLFHGIDWVIVGAESGPGARPCDLAWIRSLVEQCKAAGTKCFVKQVGPNPYERRETPSGEGYDPSDVLNGNTRDDAAHRKWFKEWTLVKTSEGSAFYRYLKLRDRKGGDMSEWPSDLRIREMPTARSTP